MGVITTTMVVGAAAAAGTAVSAYSAYEGSKAQKKAAKAAAQPQQTTSVQTPYMDETIRAMAPWVLNEGLNNYSLVNRQLGGNPGNFDALSNLLQMQSRNNIGTANNAATPNVMFSKYNQNGGDNYNLLRSMNSN